MQMSDGHPRSDVTAVAQVLCCAGPFGAYWMRMSAEYRHRHGLITYCRWHNHPPWPAQTAAHILGGCKTFRPWIVKVWPDKSPLPAHHTEWTDNNMISSILRWLKFTGHLTRPSERTSAAICLAFPKMELDGLPTDQDMDLTTLRVYVRRALGPRTQDTDPDLFDFNGQVPDFPHDL